MNRTTTNTKDTAKKHCRTTNIFNTSLGKDYRYLYQHLSIDDLDYVKEKPKHKRKDYKTDMNDSMTTNSTDSIDSTDTNDSIVNDSNDINE